MSTIDFRKKVVKSSPLDKIKTPLFKLPNIFQLRLFLLEEMKIGRPGGLPGSILFLG